MSSVTRPIFMARDVSWRRRKRYRRAAYSLGDGQRALPRTRSWRPMAATDSGKRDSPCPCIRRPRPAKASTRSTPRPSSSTSTPSSATSSPWPPIRRATASGCAPMPRPIRARRSRCARSPMARSASAARRSREAEILVEGGVTDVLVTNQIAGAAKLDRLAKLARSARISLCVDHLDGVREAAEAAARHDVVLDVSSRSMSAAGAAASRRARRRCGWPRRSRAATRCASGACRPITARPSTCARSTSGARRSSAPGARRAQHRRAAGPGRARLRRRQRRRHRHLRDRDASPASGTRSRPAPTSSWTPTMPATGRPTARPSAPSSMRSSSCAGVMSKPVPDRAVVDAGHKTAAIDSGLPTPFRRDGVVYTKPSDEHGVLTGDPIALPHRGDGCCWCRAIATRPSTCTTGMSACAGSIRRTPMSRRSGRWRRAAP